MTSTDHESVTNPDHNHRSAATAPSVDGVVSPAIKMTGVLLAVWCLGFAAVNAWQLATGRLNDDRFGDYTTALVVASVLVLLLKLAGAGMALASLRTVHHRGVRWLLGAALWAATSTLALYSAGNLIITFGTVTGLLEPTAAWETAGGVTIRAVAYVLFFLAGAVMFAVLTVSYHHHHHHHHHHRRHRLHWTAVAAGSIGPPCCWADCSWPYPHSSGRSAHRSPAPLRSRTATGHGRPVRSRRRHGCRIAFIRRVVRCPPDESTCRTSLRGAHGRTAGRPSRP